MDVSINPGSILNGFVGNILNWNTSKRNYEFQKEQFNYQKYLNTLIMAREDTAVQRKLEDLQKAGLSPYLATSGGGASSSHLVSAPAPQNNFQFSPIAMGQMNWKTKIEKRILTAQAQQAEAEARIKNKESDIVFRNPWVLFGNNIAGITAFLDDKFPGVIDDFVSDPVAAVADGVKKGVSTTVDSVKNLIGDKGLNAIDSFFDKIEEQATKLQNAKDKREQEEINRLSNWYDSLQSRLNSLPSSLVKDFKLISKNDFISPKTKNSFRKKLEKKVKILEDFSSAYKNNRY